MSVVMAVKGIAFFQCAFCFVKCNIAARPSLSDLILDSAVSTGNDDVRGGGMVRLAISSLRSASFSLKGNALVII